MNDHGPSDDGPRWIHLKGGGKELSRLLYPNPVCFLTTARSLTANDRPPCHPQDAAPRNAAAIDDASSGAFAGSSEPGTGSPSGGVNPGGVPAERNVMVLSWLTPTNNQGRFMFSINKSRYTASLLSPSIDATCRKRRYSQTRSSNDDSGCDEAQSNSNNFRTGVEFALSIPTRGMEQMVLDVGSISGRFGSKFAQDGQKNSGIDVASCTQQNLSNRQRKKIRKQRLATHGVEGLVGVPLGSSSPSVQDGTSQSAPFAIKGTVAHLRCRTYAVLGSQGSAGESGAAAAQRRCDDGAQSQPPVIDDEHLLIMAEILDAYVHPMYWDEKKLLFRPLDGSAPPYLTFFGAQTFGYVVSSPDIEKA